MMLKSWIENLKYLWRSYEDFGMYNMWAEYFKKSSISSQSCNFDKILQCWKNLGMFPSLRFWDIIFSALFNTYVYRRVLQRGRHHHIKGRRNIWSKNLDDGNNNIFFLSVALAVCRLSRIQFKPVWTGTVENYPAQKLELLSPQNK